MFLLVLLRIVHVLQSVWVLLSSVSKRVKYTPPLPLTAARRLVPNHLAVLFVHHDALYPEVSESRVIENVELLIGWCRVVGIKKLSLYDNGGLLFACQDRIRDVMRVHCDSIHLDIVSDYDLQFPPTPPLSDSSRPISPDGMSYKPQFVTIRPAFQEYTSHRKRRKSINADLKAPPTLYLLSSNSPKESVASVARALVMKHRGEAPESFRLSMNELGLHLETGNEGLPSPDFMIVHPLSPWTYHRAPLELHGFPPWQIRLTEIYLNRYHKRHRTWAARLLTSQSQVSLPLTELEFREALDKFAEAEMRFGK